VYARLAAVLRACLLASSVAVSAACASGSDTAAPGPATSAPTQATPTPTSGKGAQDDRCREFAKAFGKLVETLQGAPPPPNPLTPGQEAAFVEFDAKVKALAADSPGAVGETMTSARAAATLLRQEYPQSVQRNVASLNAEVDKVQAACGPL